MRSKCIKISVLLISLLIVICFGSLVIASQSYPTKPIEMVVPYAPGGGSDITARIFAKYAEEYFGQPMVVTNITGAGGSVGGQEVLNSKPDGYRLFWHHAAMHVSYHTGIADFTWDSFTPVCQGAFTEGNCIVVAADAPWDSIDEVLAYAKENPGEIRMAINPGATTHFIGLGLDTAIGGGKINFVAAGGDSDRVTKLLGGHLEMIPNTISVAKDYIEAGEVKGLAITGPERSEALPEVPTLVEKGYDVISVMDYGVFGPAGLPEDVVNTISKAYEEMCKDEKIIKDLNDNGTKSLYRNQEDFIEVLLEEDARYYKLARIGGMIPRD
jgi:tripartite-type tricarboxylate transporter receptor subunit TctC